MFLNSSESFSEAVKLFATSQCLLGQCFGPSVYVYDGSVFDYIVVGAGSAGCVLANRLSENPNAKVLLIDAGGNPPIESLVPGLLDGLSDQYRWSYRTENDNYSSQFSANKNVGVVISKMIGGGSSLNGMVFLRGNRRDYDRWAEQGNRGWDYNSVLPYFKRIEAMTDWTVLTHPNSSQFRGKNGPVKLKRTEEKHYAIFGKAFKEFGIEANPDFNGQSQIGFGLMDRNIFDGIRQSSAVAYLIPAQSRPNLYILKKALVSKVLIDDLNKITYGVQVITSYGKVKFYVKKGKGEVIISAGALKTPQLLMLSGIGPKDELEKHGIDMIADLPVGQNLQDHAITPFFVSASYFNETEDEVQENQFSEYFYNRTGPLSRLLSSICTFYSLNGNPYPDVQIYSTLYKRNEQLSYCSRFGYDSSFCDQLSDRDLFGFTIALMNTQSRGKILLRDRNPESAPLVYSGFGNSEEDLNVMAKFYEKFSNITEMPTFRKYKARLDDIDIKGCESYAPFSKEYWKCYFLNMAQSDYHWCCTSKMGPISDRSAVVDDELRVHNVKNLRIIDASIMPNIVSATTLNAVLMIAEKAADLIKQSNK